MNYLKYGSDFNESLDLLGNSFIEEKSINEGETNNIFNDEFEKIFCNKNMSFQNENDMNYNLEKENIEIMVKNVDGILNSLEKQIDNLKIYNTELKHINILYQLNEIYENGNININQRMKCLKLNEKLVDKLINCVNRKISNF
jgi:hypothetical protein